MVELVIMELVLNILIIGVSFVVLNWASNLAISNAIKVSAIAQLGKTAVGFSLLAFSTTLPELTVGLIAAFSAGAAISVGNVFGSNIVNICVIIGLAAMLLHLKRVKGNTSFREFFLHIGRQTKPNKSSDADEINVVPSFAKSELEKYLKLEVSPTSIHLIFGSAIHSALDVGLILLFIFVGYMYRLSNVRMPSENGEVTQEEKNKLRRYVLFTIAGALGVVASAYFLVESAVSIATSVGLSQPVIGATIIAFGTSLPELTLCLKAFLRGHPGLAFGDIIGSSFVNITLILGITLFVPALIGSPIVMRMEVFQSLVIFSIITNLFFWYFLSRERVGWREGIIFLFVYALFLASTLGFL